MSQLSKDSELIANTVARTIEATGFVYDYDFLKLYLAYTLQVSITYVDTHMDGLSYVSHWECDEMLPCDAIINVHGKSFTFVEVVNCTISACIAKLPKPSYLDL